MCTEASRNESRSSGALPPKEIITHTRPISDGGSWDEPIYYVEWEQEYAPLGGPPFPSPTPYVVEDTVFALGQRVRVAPLFVLVTARASAITTDSRQIHRITLIWQNPTLAPMPISYSAQVLLRTVRTPAGVELTGEDWRVSAEALRQAGIAALPTTIPPGMSQVTVPIIAPVGEPMVVELLVQRNPSGAPPLAPTGTLVALPTVAPTVTPAPNTDLRRIGPDIVTVAFVAHRPANPSCGDPGAATDWDTTGVTINGVADVPIQAPPGAGRLVELALAQVGKPYVWGTAGPNTFDCSGLVVWSYAQIGLHVPARTSNDQFHALKSVAAGAALPGDPMYFALPGPTKISHVAIYVGDIDGDGVGDVVHAASPKYGVTMIKGGLQNEYYFGAACALCFRGFRTMR
ncbi:MAG: NlpC/P60 family protein [Chloroflexales bacterium]